MADLDAIRRRATAATPGPWQAVGEMLHAGPPPPRDFDDPTLIWTPHVEAEQSRWLDRCQTLTWGDFEHGPDLEFVIHARQDVVDLCDEVHRWKGLAARVMYVLIHDWPDGQGWPPAFHDLQDALHADREADRG